MRLAPELKSKIDSLWEILERRPLKPAPVHRADVLPHLHEPARREGHVRAKNAQANEQPYKSIFEGQEDCRGSHWKHFQADKMLVHVRDNVFSFIKNIHDGEKTLFAQHMKDAVFLIPKPSLLQEAVTILDDLF
jgi:type I restriction enzyme M protein